MLHVRASMAWLEPLIDTFYPQVCVLCAKGRDEPPWEAAGPRVEGLRSWDRPHLCRPCRQGVFGTVVEARARGVGDVDLPVLAASETSGTLVELVGAWKYHGLRGLAWPLGRALEKAAALAKNHWEAADVLIPVPLHAGRRRERGFNQAAVLARLVAPVIAARVDGGCLVRGRDTGQQARVVGAEARVRNVAGAFRATAGPRNCVGGAVLVDDLVTSGATAAAAAEALLRRGWTVKGIVALGVADPAKRGTP